MEMGAGHLAWPVRLCLACRIFCIYYIHTYHDERTFTVRMLQSYERVHINEFSYLAPFDYSNWSSTNWPATWLVRRTRYQFRSEGVRAPIHFGVEVLGK